MAEKHDHPGMGGGEEPLDRLQEAIALYVAEARAEDGETEPVMLDVAVVIWEQVGVDDEGRTFRGVKYCVPTDNWSLSGTLGLVQAADEFIRRDLLGIRGGSDD